MFASLCSVVVLFVCVGESTVLTLANTAGAGGFQIGIGGGGWSGGLHGSATGQGALGGQLAFGYSGSGLKLPFIPIVGADQSRQPGQGTNHPQPGYGFFLGGQGSYSLQGQGGFPIKLGIPLYPIPGSPIAGAVPQAGGDNSHSGLPHVPPDGNHSPTSGNTNLPNYVPQVPQVGFPNHGYIPQVQQPGIGTQGGFIPQNSQTGHPIHQNPQTVHPLPHPIGPLPQSGIQPGAYPGQPPMIDPRNGATTSEGPIFQGRRRTLKPEPETTENPDTIESPVGVDEEAVDENTIPEDQEDK